MIIWGVSYLVCLMYGVEMNPEARAFLVCLSWLEMLFESLGGVITLFTWLLERVSK